MAEIERAIEDDRAAEAALDLRLRCVRSTMPYPRPTCQWADVNTNVRKLIGPRHFMGPRSTLAFLQHGCPAGRPTIYTVLGTDAKAFHGVGYSAPHPENALCEPTW